MTEEVRFNFPELLIYKVVLYDAIKSKKDDCSYNNALELFSRKFYEELRKVTHINYFHEIEIIESIECVLDLLPKEKKRKIKRNIRLFFRK